MLDAAVRVANLVVWMIKLALVILAGLAVLRTVLQVVLAKRHARQPVLVGRARRARLPDVSIIVPAYNQQRGIAACVR